MALTEDEQHPCVTQQDFAHRTRAWLYEYEISLLDHAEAHEMDGTRCDDECRRQACHQAADDADAYWAGNDIWLHYSGQCGGSCAEDQQ